MEVDVWILRKPSILESAMELMLLTPQYGIESDPAGPNSQNPMPVAFKD